MLTLHLTTTFFSIPAMFGSASSSSEEEPAPRLNPIEAAAAAQAQKRKRLHPSNPDDAVYKTLCKSLAEPPQNPRLPQTPPERKSRYIGKLVDAARVRKAESERLAEQKLVRQREEQDALFPHKERFVTNAYSKQLEQRAEADENQARVQSSEEHRRNQPGAHARWLRLATGEAVSARLGHDQAHITTPSPTADTLAPPAVRDTPQETPSSSQQAQLQNATMPKRRRISRFAPMQKEHEPSASAPNQQQDDEKVPTSPSSLKPPRVRGTRRNDAPSIAAYRARYLERKARRVAAATGV